MLTLAFRVLLGSAAFSLFLASALAFYHVRRQNTDDAFWSSVLAAGGWLLETAAIAAGLAAWKHSPFESSAWTLLVFIWAATAVALFVEHRFGLPVAGPPIFPLLALGLVAAMFLPIPVERHLASELQSPWVVVHVTTMFWGYSAVGWSCLTGLFYLLQERRLKAKQLSFLNYPFPALYKLDAVGTGLISLGFPLLTVGLLSGFIWAKQAFGSMWVWEPKIVMSVLLWAFYGGFAAMRMGSRWQGRRPAIVAVIGFLAVVLTFLGGILVTDSFHRF